MLGVFISSCSSRIGVSEATALHLTPLRTTQEVEDLLPYVSDLEIIQVGTDSTGCPGLSKILYSDPVIFLAGGVVFATTPDFQEIQKIGNVGRGPGEYLSIKDIAINADGDEIWCMDVLNSVFRYDLKTLAYLGKIDFDKAREEYARAMIPQANDIIALYTPNPVGFFPRRHETFNCLTYFNLSGNVIDQQLPWTQVNVMAGFSNPVSTNSSGEYILTPESSNTAYVFNDSGVDHQIVFDFGSKWIPAKFFAPKDGDPSAKLGDLFDRDCFKLISSVFYLGENLYFHAFGEDSSSWNFFLPKDGSQGIRWESIGNATIPINAIASDGEHLLFNYEDYGSTADEPDPLKKCVIQKYGLPQKSGATYLIKVKLHVN